MSNTMNPPEVKPDVGFKVIASTPYARAETVVDNWFAGSPTKRLARVVLGDIAVQKLKLEIASNLGPDGPGNPRRVGGSPNRTTGGGNAARLNPAAGQPSKAKP